MKFFKTNNGDLEISKIDPLLVFLMIQGIQQKEEEWDCIADSFLASPLAEEVLFSQDWKEYVQPGLLNLLKSAHAHVLTDLETMKRDQLSHPKNEATLLIPVDHREPWLRILNVARLSLAARHRLTEEEINSNTISNLKNERGKIILQFQLFSLLQQVLVEMEMKN